MRSVCPHTVGFYVIDVNALELVMPRCDAQLREAGLGRGPADGLLPPGPSQPLLGAFVPGAGRQALADRVAGGSWPGWLTGVVTLPAELAVSKICIIRVKKVVPVLSYRAVQGKAKRSPKI